MKRNIILCGLFIILLIIGIVVFYIFNYKTLKDDWRYKPSSHDSGYGGIKAQGGAVNTYSEDSTIGYSTGGAKDINNFRDNIKNKYFPLLTDITYEGLFYDYYFDTNTNSMKEKTDSLFYPSASTSISKDPISNKDEYYLTVGLNSNIKKSDFNRKKLNIVIVLDISGSMSSSIDNYYYDNGKSGEFKTKMQIANESVNILIDQLKDYDSLGIVLFDDQAYLAKPLNKVSEIDMKAIKRHMLKVDAMGGTNFEAGYKEALKVFDKYDISDTGTYENRIIVITDAMPNIGKTSHNELLDMMKDAQRKDINTTFIGVGVDFNSEVVKNITNVRGANYYKVSSEEEFKTRMGEQFDYMVTPMIYDLNMKLDSSDFVVEKVYGTDDIESEKNSIMHVNTLFPSSSNSKGEVKGGVILVKLKKIGDNNSLKLTLDWETVLGDTDSNDIEITFKNNNEYYDNTGIRKAIVLTRYTNTIKDWIAYDRDKNDRYIITPQSGIIDNNYSNENERISVPLTVSSKYKEIFGILKNYMNKEIKEIDDSTVNQEIEMIDKILS